MKYTLLILLLLPIDGALAQSSSPGLSTARLHVFPVRPKQALYFSIASYLKGTADEQALSALKTTELSDISKIFVILDVITEQMPVGDRLENRGRFLKPLSELLHQIEFLIQNTGITPEQKEVMRSQLHPLLQRFESLSTPHKHVINIYNKGDLWSPEEFWFLEHQASHTMEIDKYAYKIISVGKQLAPEQLASLNTAILLAGTSNLIPLLVRYQLGLLEPGEYFHLLNRLQIEFRVRTTKDLPRDSMNDVVLDHFETTRELSIQTLEDLQRRYAQQDALVVEAYKSYLKKTKTTAEIYFADMFGKEKLNLLRTRFRNIENIMEMDPLEIKTWEKEHPTLASALEKRDGNVLTIKKYIPLCRSLFIIK